MGQGAGAEDLSANLKEVPGLQRHLKSFLKSRAPSEFVAEMRFELTTSQITMYLLSYCATPALPSLPNVLIIRGGRAGSHQIHLYNMSKELKYLIEGGLGGGSPS